MKIWLRTAQRLCHFGRAERALTLAIFVLFQAMLPSYAAALSNVSSVDHLVICTEHGLMEVPGNELPLAADAQNSICLIAQSLSAQMDQAPALPTFAKPMLHGELVVPTQLFSFQQSLKFAPQAPRAPPVFS
jgi:hypothetical protein